MNRHVLKKAIYRIVATIYVVTLMLNSSLSKGVVAKSIPIAAGDFDFNNKAWNKKDLRLATNCYLYSMNFKKNPLTNKKYSYKNGIIGAQPGDFSKYIEPLHGNGIEKSSVMGRVMSDMGNIGFSIKEVKKKKIHKKIKNKKTHLVYMVVTNNSGFEKVIDHENKYVLYVIADYHWYRQDKDGYWSHKPGQSKVTRVDSEGKKIKDPSKCSKEYFYLTNEIYIINGEEYRRINVINYTGGGGFYKVKRK